jgi:pimeloyl-ACP methyl ester carboxylesterase
VMIDGAGHWLQQERPDAVNKTLLDFLSRLELR